MQAELNIIDQILETLGDVRATASSLEPGPSSTAALLDNLEDTAARRALLTLHFLFPHELLPALDLIDRRLITLLRAEDGVGPRDSESSVGQAPTITTKNLRHTLEVFYVRSASNSTVTQNKDSAGTGRFREAYHRTKHFYQVTLQAWNCNCPAFSYSAMRLLSSISDTHMRKSSNLNPSPDHVSRHNACYGGIATVPNHIVPICKHILAVCLTQSAPVLFGHGISVAEVDRNEIAGWLHD